MKQSNQQFPPSNMQCFTHHKLAAHSSQPSSLLTIVVLWSSYLLKCIMNHSKRLFSRGLFEKCTRSRPVVATLSSNHCYYSRPNNQALSWPISTSSILVTIRCFSATPNIDSFIDKPAVSSISTTSQDQISASSLLDNTTESLSLTTLTSLLPPTYSDSISVLATEAHDHIASHDLAWYNLSGYVMDLVHFTHDVTGLSYAASVASITLGIRLFLILPFGIVSLRSDPNIDQDIKNLTEKIKRTSTKVNRHTYNALLSQHKELIRRRKMQTLRSFVMPVMSFGTFLLMWFGLRYMGAYYPEDLAAGGTLWFPDLTERDPLMFLPILSSVTFLLMGEVGADQLGRPSREFSPFWANFWRLFRISTVYLFIDAPAAIFCYWIPNSSMSVLQSVVLSQPSVREAIGVIPKRKEKVSVIQFVKDTPGTGTGAIKDEMVPQKAVAGKERIEGEQISVHKKRKGKRKR